MGFQVERQGDVTVVDVEGQLIVGNRQELKQKVLEQLESDLTIRHIKKALGRGCAPWGE